MEARPRRHRATRLARPAGGVAPHRSASESRCAGGLPNARVKHRTRWVGETWRIVRPHVTSAAPAEARRGGRADRTRRGPAVGRRGRAVDPRDGPGAALRRRPAWPRPRMAPPAPPARRGTHGVPGRAQDPRCRDRRRPGRSTAIQDIGADVQDTLAEPLGPGRPASCTTCGGRIVTFVPAAPRCVASRSYRIAPWSTMNTVHVSWVCGGYAWSTNRAWKTSWMPGTAGFHARTHSRSAAKTGRSYKTSVHPGSLDGRIRSLCSDGS